jgi:hypothetical protein
MNENNGEIILYQPDNSTRLEVLLRDETVWLNRQQIADLFHRDVKTIGKHIHNANAEELKGIPTVAKFATVQKEGNRLITREKEYFNLDMILSVGYRVKSQQGVMFRRWANTVLKDYFFIIDNTVYHLGASVKDLGKKLFAFNRMGATAEEILHIANGSNG